MNKFEWNPVFKLVMRIKKDYSEKFGTVDTMSFEHWMARLNKVEYLEIFKHLKVNQHDNFILIRYGMDEMHETMWSDKDSIYRECRGIVIDIAKEQIVLVPFRKFFNLNEIEENKLESVWNEIRNAKSIEITDKLDGSMQSARFYEEGIFLAGSMALDRANSWRLEDGYNKLSDNHKRMIAENPEYTFVFEYISLRDAHVVVYQKDKEGMYLIGMRNVFSGKQMPYREVKAFSDKYSVPMTSIEQHGFDEILKSAKEFKSCDKEGWVLNIDGHMIKLKCDDYVQLHRVLGSFSSANTVIRNIADGTFDDLISKVPENYKERLTILARAIYDYVGNMNRKIDEHYSRALKADRKEYMIWVTENCPKEIQGYMRQKYLGQDFNVLKTCYKESTKYRKLSEIDLDGLSQAAIDDLEDA